MNLLVDFPRLGRDRPEWQVRALGVASLPYKIYYGIGYNCAP